MTKLTYTLTSWPQATRFLRAVQADAHARGQRLLHSMTGRTPEIELHIQCDPDYAPVVRFIAEEAGVA